MLLNTQYGANMKYFLMISFLALTSQTFSQEHQIDQTLIEDIRNEGRKLYSELLTLKSDPKFLREGFSYTQSKSWDARQTNLNDKCIDEIQKLPLELRLSGEFSELCRSIHNLGMMGLRYAIHAGTDDDFTESIKPQVISHLGNE